jgi:choline dehydrogenase-like flavoprotein
MTLAPMRDGVGDWPIRYADLAPWYDKVESFVGVSGAAEGMPALPDGQFQPPMALNAVEKSVREKVLAQWPDRRLTIGRTANLTRARKKRAARPANRSICAAAARSAPISRRNPAPCPPRPDRAT